MTHTSNLAVYRPTHEESLFHSTTHLRRHLQHQAWERAIAKDTTDPDNDTNPTYATALIVPTCTCALEYCEYPSTSGRHYSLYWAYRDYREAWDVDGDEVPRHKLNGWSTIGAPLHSWAPSNPTDQSAWAELATRILDQLTELSEPKLSYLHRARAGQWRYYDAANRAEDTEKSWAALWANARRIGDEVPYIIDDQLNAYHRRLANERRALAGLDPIEGTP